MDKIVRFNILGRVTTSGHTVVSDTFPDNNGEGDAEFHLGTAQHQPVLGLQVRNRPDIRFVSGTENISD